MAIAGELAFAQLLDEAAALTDQLREMVHPTAILSPEAAPLEFIPALRPWFTAQYLAGLELLRNPAVAPAADSVLRGLVELFAAVAWISEGGSREERPCRAVCYEAGLVRTIRNQLQGQLDINPGAADRNERLIQIEQLIQTDKMLSKQRVDRKCKCQLWKYSKVGPVLKDVSMKHKDLSWAYDTWVWASTVAHQTIPLFPDEGGEEELAPASIQERSIQLMHFLRLLVNFGLVAIPLRQPESAERWRRLADDLVKTETFVESTKGELDRN